MKDTSTTTSTPKEYASWEAAVPLSTKLEESAEKASNNDKEPRPTAERASLQMIAFDDGTRCVQVRGDSLGSTTIIEPRLNPDSVHSVFRSHSIDDQATRNNDRMTNYDSSHRPFLGFNSASRSSSLSVPDNFIHQYQENNILLGDTRDDWESEMDDYYGYFVGPEDEDEMFAIEPIPLHVLAAGAPVEADDGSFIHPESSHAGQMLGAVVSPTVTEYESRMDCSSVRHTMSYCPPLPAVVLSKTVEVVPMVARRPIQQQTATTSVSTSRRTDAGTHKRTAHAPADGTEEPSNKKLKTSGVVGPDSEEMLVVERMMIYLEETCDNAQLVQTFRKVVKDCETGHAKGQVKYKHLPGAIFERLVEQVDGPTFKHIYQASRDFDHPRVRELYPDDSTMVVPRSSLDYQQLTSSSGIGMPNLLQVAVGYGFHLARMSMLNHADVDESATIQELMESGAETALNMKEDERFLFWKYMIESPMVKEHLAGNFRGSEQM